MVRIQRWRSQWQIQPPELFQFLLFEQFANVEHGISTRHSEARQTKDVQPAQPHGDKAAWVKLPGTVDGVDAVLTREQNLRLRIGTSDCVPLIVYDPIRRQGGVIHAGMKGTSQDILSTVLRQFRPQQIWLGIGPAIGQECYNGIHLQRENILQAVAAGVPDDHIEVMPWCTKCHQETFFSYRAGDRQNFGTYFRLVKS